ncbi:MAG TPA: SDR family NAD(P)-dependent oxidoreductase [Acidimicrobiales bacterium]
MGNVREIPRGWDETSVPPQPGRRYLVTGGTSGLGEATAKALRLLGAHVTITARNAAKAEAIVAAGGASDVLVMDLTDLSSVRDAAAQVREPYDVMILNAGIMWTPYRLTTDGFESQVGTNYLGHFAFAGLIKDFITERLVTVSSLYQRYGSFGDGSLEEIQRRCLGQVPYSSREAYGDSKLANVLFTEEIERRRAAQGWKFIALTAHPGWSNTNLFGEATSSRDAIASLASLSSRLMAQSAARGALPQLCAATFPGLRGGEYVGPRGPGQLRGTPTIVQPVVRAHDAELASNLWRVSEELTGVTWT